MDHRTRQLRPLTIATLAVGVGIGTLVFAVQRGQENDRIHLAFREALHARGAEFERELQALTATLESLRALFDASEDVTAEEFATFSRGPLERLPAVQALGWAPLVGGATAEEAPRAPLRFVAPLAGGVLVPGRDVAAEPRFAYALARARDLGGAVADAAGPDPAAPIAMVLPVYPRGASPPGEPVGFVLLSFRLPSLAAATSGAPGAAGLALRLEAPTGLRRLLRQTGSFTGFAPSFAVPIRMGAIEWRLRGEPTPAFYEGRRTALPLTMGVLAGLLWTLLGGLGVLVAGLAQRRALARQDRTLRDVLEQLNEGVVVSGPDRTVLYANAAARNLAGSGPAADRSGIWATTSGCFLADQRTPYPAAQLPLARALEGEHVPPEEIFFRCEGRQEGRWLSVSGTPLRSSTDNLQGGVIVFRDVTEHRLAERRRIEMNLAAEVQSRLYPTNGDLDAGGYDIAGAVCSAEATSGDYYDVMRLADGTVALAIGDVCGKGVCAALVMTQVRAYFRSFVRTTGDPATILARMNEVLAEDLQDGRFVTLLVVLLEPATGRIRYANAGHVPGFALDPEGAMHATLRRTGPPLGLFAESRYETGAGVVAPGDLLVMFTDGVTESRNGEGECLWEEGALDVVRASRRLDAAGIVDALQQGLHRWCGGRKQDDDTTILVCKRPTVPAPAEPVRAAPSRPSISDPPATRALASPARR